MTGKCWFCPIPTKSRCRPGCRKGDCIEERRLDAELWGKSRGSERVMPCHLPDSEYGMTGALRMFPTDRKIDRLAIPKLDLLITQVQALIGAVAETKNDNKATRTTVWEVGIGTVVAALIVIVAIWIAGEDIQAKMLSRFQADIAEHLRSSVAKAKAP